MKLHINEELRELIPPLSIEERSTLEQSLLNEGCRDAIVTWNGTIIDGHNRYELCTKNGIHFRNEEKQFDTIDDVKQWMIVNQFGRRNLSAYQRSLLALELETLYRRKAKENQVRTTENRVLQNSAKQAIDTRKELATIANVSHDTIAKVKVIKEKANDEVKSKLETGELTIHGAYKEIKNEEKKQERTKQIEEIKEKIKNEPVPKIDRKYDVIAIDPPWNYGREYDPESSRVANPYPEMTVQEISKIKLPSSNDSVLFLWTTHAFIKDSFYLMDNWGYNYKATMVWDKEKMGMGATIRMQCEFCLIGIKGKPIINGSSERDIIRESRRQHSRKPEEFYKMVDRMCVGYKLDYFSRENREGWDVYGAETGKF